MCPSLVCFVGPNKNSLAALWSYMYLGIFIVVTTESSPTPSCCLSGPPPPTTRKMSVNPGDPFPPSHTSSMRCGKFSLNRWIFKQVIFQRRHRYRLVHRCFCSCQAGCSGLRKSCFTGRVWNSRLCVSVAGFCVDDDDLDSVCSHIRIEMHFYTIIRGEYMCV